MSTCTATLLPDLPAAVLWWAHDVQRADVMPAFRHLDTLISMSATPLYVLVDLREKPTFPLTDTLRGALDGPFRNPNLAEWLVVGSTPLAQTIGRTLSAITRRNNIRWFKTLEAAMEFLSAAAHGAK
ncbi:MAG: hypothetical protein KA401_03890 [Anaerolineae bacterium]|nr:hypothetical protein [Chloroflexota bacterium]MBP6298465.1 hypothetical protein [Anaerolineae bacterium]